MPHDFVVPTRTTAVKEPYCGTVIGQQNKNGPRHLYLAAEMSEGLADQEGVDYE